MNNTVAGFMTDGRATAPPKYALLAACIVAAMLVFTQLGLGTRLCTELRGIQYARAIGHLLPPCWTDDRSPDLR